MNFLATSTIDDDKNYTTNSNAEQFTISGGYLNTLLAPPVGCGIDMPDPDSIRGAAPVVALFNVGERTLVLLASPGVSTEVR